MHKAALGQQLCVCSTPQIKRTHFTFKDDLHKVLCGHLALPGEALIGPAVTLGHPLHDEVLPVESSETDIAAGVDDLAVAVP